MLVYTTHHTSSSASPAHQPSHSPNQAVLSPQRWLIPPIPPSLLPLLKLLALFSSVPSLVSSPLPHPIKTILGLHRPYLRPRISNPARQPQCPSQRFCTPAPRTRWELYQGDGICKLGWMGRSTPWRQCEARGGVGLGQAEWVEGTFGKGKELLTTVWLCGSGFGQILEIREKKRGGLADENQTEGSERFRYPLEPNNVVEFKVVD